jgi:predicted kinase
MQAELILVRGLPGSGKSTVAKKIGGRHLEADMYFMEGGEYKFDANRIRDAHEWCQSETRRNLEIGNSVVVSNTFTTIKELRPYFDIAKEFNIVPSVITCHNQFANVHNVPEETLARMKARFATDVSELFV